MTAALSPVRFDPPLINPSAPGLWSVTQWTESEEPLRWLPLGVEIRPWNFGFDALFGVWAAEWCARESDLGPEDVKAPADRPAPLAAFAAITTWAADECDLTAPSRDEVRSRASLVHRLQEPLAVEREFAARMLDDAGTVSDTASDIVGAVGHLEDLLAETNSYGFIHARPSWAASAAQANLIVRTGAATQDAVGAHVGVRWRLQNRAGRCPGGHPSAVRAARAGRYSDSGRP